MLTVHVLPCPPLFFSQVVLERTQLLEEVKELRLALQSVTEEKTQALDAIKVRPVARESVFVRGHPSRLFFWRLGF